MKDEDQRTNHELATKLIAEQNFTAAVVAGAVATLLAAIAYGITVETWPYSYGFAAAAIGVFVGAAMQFLGRGIATKFAVMAAVYTVAGCVLGNLFVRVFDLAKATGTSPVEVLRNNSWQVLSGWSVAGLSFVQLVFWFVAVFVAVFLVTRPLSRAERLALGQFELRN